MRRSAFALASVCRGFQADRRDAGKHRHSPARRGTSVATEELASFSLRLRECVALCFVRLERAIEVGSMSISVARPPFT